MAQVNPHMIKLVNEFYIKHDCDIIDSINVPIDEAARCLLVVELSVVGHTDEDFGIELPIAHGSIIGIIPIILCPNTNLRIKFDRYIDASKIIQHGHIITNEVARNQLISHARYAEIRIHNQILHIVDGWAYTHKFHEYVLSR